jgi:hypothetical protein
MKNEEIENIVPNQSVTKLELKQCDRSPHLSTRISNIFPNVDALSIVHSIINYNDPKRKFALELPNASLKKLELSMMLSVLHYNPPDILKKNGLYIIIHTDEKVDHLWFSFPKDKIQNGLGCTFFQIKF